MDTCIYPEEVSLFQKPCNNIAYQKIQYVDYRPTSLLSSGVPLTFTIPPTGSQYINLKKSYLRLLVKIVNDDGTDMKEQKMVAPINNVLHSLFNQVDVQLQQQLVSTGQNYGYKAYMETLLQFGSDAKESQLQAQCFIKDKAGYMDTVVVDPRQFDEDGMQQRMMWFMNSTPLELIGPLMADICQQDRLILNGVEIQIKLWPSKDTFRLNSSEESPSYKMKIMDASLKVCKVTPSPALMLGHADVLKESNALYPYKKTQIKTFNIPVGQYDFQLDDLYQGQVPSRLVVAMVKSKAFNGDYKLNPYNLEHFEISSLGVYVNDESVPGKPLQMDFAATAEVKWMTAYYAMFAGMNRDGEDWGNDINFNEFASGYGLFVYDLLPEDQPSLMKASVKVEGIFKNALTENVTVIVYGKFPTMLEITEARSVLMSNP